MGTKLYSGSTLTLVCDRRHDTAISSEGQKHYIGGIIGVATSSDTAQIPLIGYAVPSVHQPEAELLRRDINNLRNEMLLLQRKNEQTLKGLGVVSDLEFFRCPEFAQYKPGVLGGGKWGFYGCQGQVTTQKYCVLAEYPSWKNIPCRSIGKIRIEK